MTGIGEIRPQVPIWPAGEAHPIKPSGGHRQMPRRQPNKNGSNKPENDEDHDDPSHIDEYA